MNWREFLGIHSRLDAIRWAVLGPLLVGAMIAAVIAFQGVKREAMTIQHRVDAVTEQAESIGAQVLDVEKYGYAREVTDVVVRTEDGLLDGRVTNKDGVVTLLVYRHGTWLPATG